MQSRTALSIDAVADLSWWLDQANFSLGKPIVASSPSVTIFIDASLSGWGAVCQEVKTSGPWSQEERLLHINDLELVAALYGLNCFTDSSRDTSAELRIDNTSAVSYINKLGEGENRPRFVQLPLRLLVGVSFETYSYQRPSYRECQIF